MEIKNDGEQLEDANYTNVEKSIISEKVSQSETGGIGSEDLCSEVAEGSSFGKFNSAEELLSAYNNLQAEFTRKCQKLSELKKSEVAQQCEYLSNDWENKVAQFVSTNQNAKKYASEICDVLMTDSVIASSKDSLNLAYQKVLSGKYREVDDLLKDKEFIEKVAECEDVKRRVLSQSLKGVVAPPSIMGKEGAVLRARGDAPKNIYEAGQVVLNLFKQKK